MCFENSSRKTEHSRLTQCRLSRHKLSRGFILDARENVRDKVRVDADIIIPLQTFDLTCTAQSKQPD